MSLYEGIVEVRRCRFHGVNHLLQHDYRLLAIMGVTQARKKPQPDGQFYVHRGVEYVLGRTADTSPAPLVPAQQAREPEPAEAAQEG